MAQLKKLKYKLDSYCKHKFILAKTYTSKPTGEVNFKLNGKYLRRWSRCQ